MNALLKAAGWMAAGAMLLLLAEVCAMTVPKGTCAARAERRAASDELYGRIQMSPIDEFAGLGEGEWSK